MEGVTEWEWRKSSSETTAAKNWEISVTDGSSVCVAWWHNLWQHEKGGASALQVSLWQHRVPGGCLAGLGEPQRGWNGLVSRVPWTCCLSGWSDFADVITSRFLWQGAYSGSSGWANTITKVPLGRRQGGERRPCDGGSGAGEPLKALKVEEGSPKAEEASGKAGPQRRCSPVGSSLLTQRSPLWTSQFHNCEVINLCCFKLSNWWWFVRAAIGK